MIRKLWDSSEIREAAALFNDIFKFSTAPAALAEKKTGTEKEPSGGANLGDLLEEVLVSMCGRGDFTGSVLADNDGLPLAVYNSPAAEDLLAALTSLLGKSLAETGRLLNQPNANNISMEINYIDKLVLKKFPVDDKPYFLMIIAPQNVDERAELELSIDLISNILKRK